MTQHQNFSISHYVFRCVDSCKSFLFASTKYHSFTSITLTEYWSRCMSSVSSDDWKLPDRQLKFSFLFTCTYLCTFITYLLLSLFSLYAYISIFISFYDRFSCLNASVLTVLITISFMNSLILIQRVFWIFVHLCLSIYLFIHTHCMLRTCFIAHAN